MLLLFCPLGSANRHQPRARWSSGKELDVANQRCSEGWAGAYLQGSFTEVVTVDHIPGLNTEVLGRRSRKIWATEKPEQEKTLSKAGTKALPILREAPGD